MKVMQDINLKNKRVLIREDFNVPLDHQGAITSDRRIRAAIPTIQLALKKGAAVILVSHLGRPKEGVWDEKLSLAPVAARLSELLNIPVKLVANWQSGLTIQPGTVVLLENIRFNKGEEADSAVLAKQLAALADVFVMDAFATAHRAQASTHGVAQFAPIACAGPLLKQELDSLGKVLANPARPLAAIVGGSKVSTKLAILKNLIDKVDQLIIGGGIANTFLAAAGYNVGLSLYENGLIGAANEIMRKAEKLGVEIPLPTDVVTAKTVSADAITETKKIAFIEADDRILDIGPETIMAYTTIIKNAKTILWNGPVGMFELAPFANGTQKIALAMTSSSAFTVAGGGDTIAAIEQLGISDKISYISTGGGAFLELLEGKALPGVTVLTEHEKK